MSSRKLNKNGIGPLLLPITRKLDYNIEPTAPIEVEIPEIIELNSCSSIELDSIHNECIIIDLDTTDETNNTFSVKETPDILADKFNSIIISPDPTENTKTAKVVKSAKSVANKEYFEEKTGIRKANSFEQIPTLGNVSIPCTNKQGQNRKYAPHKPMISTQRQKNQVLPNPKTPFITNRRARMLPKESEMETVQIKKDIKAYRSIIVEHIQNILDRIEKWRQFQYKFFERSPKHFSEEVASALRYANLILAEDVADFLLLADATNEINEVKDHYDEIKTKWNKLQLCIGAAHANFDALDKQRIICKDSPNARAVHEGSAQIAKKTRSRIPIL